MVSLEQAPPRRKSCEACKIAKRRCDLAFPACSRCISRGSPCVYPGRLPAAYQNIVDEPPSAIATTDPMGLHADLTPPFYPDGDLHTNSTLNFAPNLIESQSEWTQQDTSDWSSTLLLDESLTNIQFAVALPRTRSLRPLSAIVASHLQFAIDVLKNAPNMMVLENSTPWCHPQLYKNHMPRAMQGMTGLYLTYFKHSPELFMKTDTAF